MRNAVLARTGNFFVRVAINFARLKRLFPLSFRIAVFFVFMALAVVLQGARTDRRVGIGSIVHKSAKPVSCVVVSSLIIEQCPHDSFYAIARCYIHRTNNCNIPSAWWRSELAF